MTGTLTYQQSVERKCVCPLDKSRFIAILVFDIPMAADCVFSVVRKVGHYCALAGCNPTLIRTGNVDPLVMSLCDRAGFRQGMATTRRTRKSEHARANTQERYKRPRRACAVTGTRDTTGKEDPGPLEMRRQAHRSGSKEGGDARRAGLRSPGYWIGLRREYALLAHSRCQRFSASE